LNKSFIHKNQTGFTLVEILVSLTIFVIVTVVSITAFIQIITAQRKADLSRMVYEEGRFFMEKMVKEIRNNTIDYAFYYLEQNKNAGLNYYDYLNEAPHRSNTSVKIASQQPILAMISPDGKSRTMFWRDGNLSTGSNQPADSSSNEREEYRLVTKKMTYLNAENPLADKPAPVPPSAFKAMPVEDPYQPGGIGPLGSLNWAWYAGSPYSDGGASNEEERIQQNWEAISPTDLIIEELHFLLTPQQDPYQFWDTSTVTDPDEQASLISNQVQPRVTIILKVSPIERRLRGIAGTAPSISLQTTVSARLYRSVHYQGWPQER